jgi:quinol monooxygenase YgiN
MDVAITMVQHPITEVNMITMTVIAKVKPEKVEEFIQVMSSFKREKKSRACPKSFLVLRQVHEPIVFNLVCEWEKDPDLECYLDGEEFRIFRGAITVLCEESTFMCNSISEKWSSLNIRHEYHPMGSEPTVAIQSEAKNLRLEFGRELDFVKDSSSAVE